MAKRAFEVIPGERWLFLFAHPDDELAILAWIAHLAAEKSAVRCVWMHSNPVREAESRAVMARVGVSDLHFHQLPDGAMVDHLEDLVGIAQAQGDWDRVVTMAYEQGHLDHDSVNFAANHAHAGRVLEFPMYWAYYRGFMHLNEFASGPQEVRELSVTDQALKREAIRMYPSQTIRRNIFWYGVYRRLVGRPLRFESRELLRWQAETDFGQTIHTGRTAEKVVASRHWQRWSEAVRNDRA